MNKLEIIRAACIKANHDMQSTSVIAGCPNCHEHDGAKITINVDRPVRLADVLLALSTQQVRVQYSAGDDARIDYLRVVPDTWEVAGSWNLRKDDLTQQSPETIQFIHDLLSK